MPQSTAAVGSCGTDRHARRGGGFGGSSQPIQAAMPAGSAGELRLVGDGQTAADVDRSEPATDRGPVLSTGPRVADFCSRPGTGNHRAGTTAVPSRTPQYLLRSSGRAKGYGFLQGPRLTSILIMLQREVLFNLARAHVLARVTPHWR